MRVRSGLWVAAFALLSFLALMPQTAYADNVGGGSIIMPATQVQAPQPIATTLCPANNATDTAYTNNAANFMQNLMQAAHNISTAFPIASSLTPCLTTLMNAITSMPNGNPLNIVTTVVTAALKQIVSSIIGQVCSAVMGEIKSVQAVVTDLTKICIPMPNFKLSLDLPKITASTCTNGTGVQLLGNFSSTGFGRNFTPNTYLH